MDSQLPKQPSHNRARRARRIHRFLSVSIGLAIALAVASVVVAYALSESKINEEYLVADAVLTLDAKQPDIERGERLVRGVLRCTECHEKDLGGKVIVDTEIGRVAAPNLTRGDGGIWTSLSNAAWIRALRHGVGRDDRGLWMMPTSRLSQLQDQEIVDIIAYIGTVPSVARVTEVSQLGLLGRLVHAMGKLTLIEARTERAESSRTEPEGAVARGRHLSELAGCSGCHGPNLRGEGQSIGADLVGGSFQTWSSEGFIKAMRQGIRPDSEAMSDDMPWPEFGRLTDSELTDLFEYLKSLGSKG